jgi:hypothetical protein
VRVDEALLEGAGIVRLDDKLVLTPLFIGVCDRNGLKVGRQFENCLRAVRHDFVILWPS